MFIQLLMGRLLRMSCIVLFKVYTLNYFLPNTVIKLQA